MVKEVVLQYGAEGISQCQKCYGIIDEFYGSLRCTTCESSKYFMKATQACEKCPGTLTVEVENDATKTTDNEYKCLICNDETPGTYYNSDQKKCVACGANKTLATDNFSCVDCVGTVSVDFKTCTPCAANTYFDGTSKTCLDCVGEVSSDKKTCTTCGTAKYFNSTSKTCVDCIGTVSEDKKTCTPCSANKAFDLNNKVCYDCPGTVSSDIVTCTKCPG